VAKLLFNHGKQHRARATVATIATNSAN
jgi:hypothetical protein